MKHFFKVAVVLVFVLLSSCTDKCVEGKKGTPPGLFLNLVDVISNENVFENETFKESHIVLTDQQDIALEYTFIENSNLINVFPNYNKNFKTTIIVLKLQNPDTMEERNLQINVNYDLESYECFTNYSIQSLDFVNTTSQLDNYIYTVKI